MTRDTLWKFGIIYKNIDCSRFALLPKSLFAKRLISRVSDSPPSRVLIVSVKSTGRRFVFYCFVEAEDAAVS